MRVHFSFFLSRYPPNLLVFNQEGLMKTINTLWRHIFSTLLIIAAAFTSPLAHAVPGLPPAPNLPPISTLPYAGIKDPFAIASHPFNALSPNARTWAGDLRGLVQLPDLTVNLESQGRLIMSGTIDLNRFGIVNGNSQSQVLGNALTGVRTLVNQLGVLSSNVPIVIAIAPASGGVLGLSLSFTFSIVIPQPRVLTISNEIGTAVMASRLDITLSATQALTTPPFTSPYYTIGGTGSLYVQPTRADGWIATQSTLAVDTMGKLFVSANFVGACASQPTAAGQSCTGEWDVLGFGLARAKAARLDLTFLGDKVVRVVGAISDGWLGGSREVGISGVVIADAASAASGGIALNITGQPTLQSVLYALSGNAYAVAKVTGIADRLPNPKLPLKAGAKVVATPFTLYDKTSNVNITKPTFSIELQAGGSGVDVNLYAGVEADILKLLNKQLGAALPVGSASFAVVFDNAVIKSAVTTETERLLGKNMAAATRTVFDLAMSGFTFDRATAAIDLRNPAAATANLRFGVFGQWVDLSASAESVAAPAASIAAEVKRKIEAQLALPCPSGQEKDAGLCYPKCNAGFYGVATKCQPYCPSGWKDSGVGSCARPTYGRADYSTEKACREKSGKSCEKEGWLWYPNCSSGYTGTLLTCTANCPGGWPGNGALYCGKPGDYSRGVGKLPGL
jgi:hypothetical protein